MHAAQISDTHATAGECITRRGSHFVVNATIVHTGGTQTVLYEMTPEEAFTLAGQLQHAATEAMVESAANRTERQ